MSSPKLSSKVDVEKNRILVFSSNDLIFQWDGKYGNVISEDGIYTYRIKCITNSNIELNYLGHISLLK